MIKNHICQESMCIVKVGERRIWRKVTDLKVGDYVRGFDLNNNKDCWNKVLYIEQEEVPESEHISIWYNTDDYSISNFVVTTYEQELDYYSHYTNSWEYKLARNIEVGDKIKSLSDNIVLSHKDTNVTRNEKFLNIRLDNSHNIYIRKHESGSKWEQDVQNLKQELDKLVEKALKPLEKELKEKHADEEEYYFSSDPVYEKTKEEKIEEIKNSDSRFEKLDLPLEYDQEYFDMILFRTNK